jgi:hypothetical protein
MPPVRIVKGTVVMYFAGGGLKTSCALPPNSNKERKMMYTALKAVIKPLSRCTLKLLVFNVQTRYVYAH